MITTTKRNCYRTPHWCFNALTTYINWSRIDLFYEPCSGDGRIIEWAKHYQVDKPPTRFIDNEPQRGGYDFINVTLPAEADVIISNPPYTFAEEFVEHGFNNALASCWLLRLGFLASQQRKKLFEKHPLTALYVLSKRPSFDGNGTDNSEYAWFIWDNPENPIFNKHGIVHL